MEQPKPVDVQEAKLQRANKRLHYRQALQGVRNAFDKLDKAIQGLSVEDYIAVEHSNIYIMRAHDEFGVHARTAEAKLKPLQ